MSHKEQSQTAPVEEPVATESAQASNEEQELDTSAAVDSTAEGSHLFVQLGSHVLTVSLASQNEVAAKDDTAPAAASTEDKETAMEDAIPSDRNDATALEGETTSSAKKGQKRRSSAGVPEHKNKKLNRKKSVATLRLDAQPGDYYWARLKGYPPWPSIICDEEMLPESLLISRPVTTKRPDGSYRVDYQDDGKNVRDRTYPVMFLYTNEL